MADESIRDGRVLKLFGAGSDVMLFLHMVMMVPWAILISLKVMNSRIVSMTSTL
jgi:hypothetical protein